MSEVSLVKLDEILTVLTEAARGRGTVRVYLREPDGSGRPMRIVEGVVLDVADGRDGRTRVRFSIPTGAGEPVEVRVLVEGIDRAEPVSLPANTDASRTNSGPFRRPTDSFVAPKLSEPVAEQRYSLMPGERHSLVPNAERNSIAPDQTGRRRRS